MDWISNKKKSTIVLLGIWILSYFFSFLILKSTGAGYQKFFTAVFLGVVQTVCPLLIFLVLFVENGKLDLLFKCSWTRALVPIFVFSCGIVSHAYARSVLNNIFKVDPGYFVIASSLLTASVFVLGLFYFFVTLSFIGILVVGWVPVWFISFFREEIESVAGNLPPVTHIIGVFVLICFSYVQFENLRESIPQLVEVVAIEADFNAKHRCVGTWDVPIDKVIFLDGGNVLAHVAAAGKQDEYKILPCNLQ
jgi:hypothetical protein